MENQANHTIHSFRFDLLQLSQQPHHQIENRIVRMLDQSISKTIQRVIDQQLSDDLILDQLVIDLGEIEQESLEQQLPFLLERALADWFRDYEALEAAQAQKEEKKEELIHPLLHYLFFGLYPWYDQKRSPFQPRWLAAIKSKGFIQQIYRQAWPNRAIKRLVQVAYLKPLEATLRALVPQAASFILSFHQEALQLHEEGELKEKESKQAFHHIIWEFSLRYVLNAKGGFFSKKQFVAVQMHLLASHYNIRISDFFQLFFKSFQRIKTLHAQQFELYNIMQSLMQEERWTAEESDAAEVQLGIQQLQQFLSSKPDPKRQQIIRAWLLSSAGLDQVKRYWLNPLKEELLYATLEVLIGKEAVQTVATYHEQLWVHREKVEAKPVTDAFRQAVWSFTLDYFQRSFSSYFEAKAFIRYHSMRMARRFNLSFSAFLKALIKAASSLENERHQLVQLLAILKSLDRENQTEEAHKKKRTAQQNWQAFLRSYQAEQFETSQQKLLFLKHWGERLLAQYDLKKKVSFQFLIEWAQQLKIKLPESLNTDLRQFSTIQIKQSDTYALAELEATAKVLRDWKQEEDLRRFIKNKSPLQFSLLLKLIAHEPRLSDQIVTQLRIAFQDRAIQKLFLEHWLFRLQAKEIERLIGLLWGDTHAFVVDSFQIFKAAFPQQTPKVTHIFLKQLFAQQGTLQTAAFWEQQLQQFSEQLQIKTKPLQEALQLAMLQLAQSKHHLLLYHEFLYEEPKVYYKAKLQTAGKEGLLSFRRLELDQWKALSRSEQQKWEQFIFQLLLKEPEHWHELKLSEASLQIIDQMNALVQQLFQLRTLHEEQKLLKFVAWQNVTQTEQWLGLLLFLEYRNTAPSLDFKQWSKQDLLTLSGHLFQDKRAIRQWVKLPTAHRTLFLQQSSREATDLLLLYFQQLQALYADLSPRNRPYQYAEFELTFWQFVFQMHQKSWSVMEMLERWMQHLKSWLGVAYLANKEIEGKIGANREKQWQALKSRLLEKEPAKESIEQLIEELEEVDEELIPESLNGIEVPHVGIIILHPFLRQLFRNLGFLDPQFQFKGKLQQSLAVYTLHYLACGERYAVDEIEESDLAFPKLLCGLPIAETLELPEELNAKSYEMADQLLNACLSHWDKLNNSSRASLQNTFLKRSGRIEEVDEAYQVHIEKSGVDILLDSLPWSISLIKFPWLAFPIYASWR